MDMRKNLENMLAQGRDNALLRFTLGELCLNSGEAATAAEHLRAAVAQDAQYSAAWKLYGRALAANSQNDQARQVFEQGIAVAEQRGDHQAAKEMRVFLKRLARSQQD